MANVLKVAMQQAIATLLGRGRSQRYVARELGLSRKTVSRYVRLAREGEAKDAIPTAGSAGSGDGSKGAIPTTGSAGRRSDCEPFREAIREKVALGLSAQRIWQDLRDESESAPGYESVKRFVRRLEGAGKISSSECMSLLAFDISVFGLRLSRPHMET